MKPLVVYLDTHDYVDFSLNRHSDVKKFICKCVDDGVVVVPNSFPLMLEVVQDVDSDHYDERIKRVCELQRITNGWSFNFPLRINGNVPKLSNDGEWCQPSEFVNADISTRDESLIMSPLGFFHYKNRVGLANVFSKFESKYNVFLKNFIDEISNKYDGFVGAVRGGVAENDHGDDVLNSFVKFFNKAMEGSDIIVDSVRDVICTYAYSKRKNANMKISYSDMGDIFHAFYISKCDLWRGDRKFSNVLKQYCYPEINKVVFDINDLKSMIEEKLKN